MRILCVLAVSILVIGFSNAGEDQASHCRTGGANDNCDTFGRCCGRHCQGPHDSSCTEDDGRIVSTNCYCEGNSEDGEQNVGLRDLSARPDDSYSPSGSRRPSTSSDTGTLGHREGSLGGRQDSHGSLGGRQNSHAGSVGGRESISGRQDTLGSRQESLGGSGGHGRQDSVGGSSLSGGRRESMFATTLSTVSDRDSAGTVGDHASICRTRSSTCAEFTNCCDRACPSPVRNVCNPGELYYAICRCPGDVSIDRESHAGRPSSPGGSFRDPIRESTATGPDHTSTCKITANNDCLAFKRCCSTNCERKYSSRCSGDGRGRIMSAFCKCTSSTTTSFSRPGSLNTSPHRDTDSSSINGGTGGGFHDHTQTCKNLATSGSCDSFNTCCRTRCGSSGNLNQSCNSRNGEITTATCTCRG